MKNFTSVERDAISILDAVSTICKETYQTSQAAAYLLHVQTNLVWNRYFEVGIPVVTEYHGTHIEMIRTDTGDTVAILGAAAVSDSDS